MSTLPKEFTTPPPAVIAAVGDTFTLELKALNHAALSADKKNLDKAGDHFSDNGNDHDHDGRLIEPELGSNEQYWSCLEVYSEKRRLELEDKLNNPSQHAMNSLQLYIFEQTLEEKENGIEPLVLIGPATNQDAGSDVFHPEQDATFAGFDQWVQILEAWWKQDVLEIQDTEGLSVTGGCNCDGNGSALNWGDTKEESEDVAKHEMGQTAAMAVYDQMFMQHLDEFKKLYAPQYSKAEGSSDEGKKL